MSIPDKKKPKNKSVSKTSRKKTSKKGDLGKILAVGAGTAAGIVLLGLLNKNKDAIKGAIKTYNQTSMDNRNVEAILVNNNNVLNNQMGNKLIIPNVISTNSFVDNSPVTPIQAPLAYTGSPVSYTTTPTFSENSRFLEIPYTNSPVSYTNSSTTSTGSSGNYTTTPVVSENSPVVYTNSPISYTSSNSYKPASGSVENQVFLDSLPKTVSGSHDTNYYSPMTTSTSSSCVIQ